MPKSYNNIKLKAGTELESFFTTELLDIGGFKINPLHIGGVTIIVIIVIVIIIFILTIQNQTFYNRLYVLFSFPNLYDF